MKKINGNIWAASHCNRLVHERMENRQHERHIRALETCRGMIDSSSPKEQPHLRSKPKTRKLQEDRASEIQLENRILLQKMLNIDTKASQFSSMAMSSQRAVPRSLNGGSQRREAGRVATANHELLRRLQNTRPSIDPHQWEEEEIDRQALRYRLSQNASRGRVVKLRMPDRLVMDGRMPKLSAAQVAAQFHENEWAELTNQELDRHLKECERFNENPQPALPAPSGLNG